MRWHLAAIVSRLHSITSKLGLWCLPDIVRLRAHACLASAARGINTLWYRATPGNLLWPTLAPAQIKATVHVIRDDTTGAPIDCCIWIDRGWETLWQNGSFGKGILSRSDPTWLGRYQRAVGEQADGGQQYIEEITARRRELRRERTSDPEHLESMRDLDVAGAQADMEPVQLSPFEALFLSELQSLTVHDDTHIYSHAELYGVLSAGQPDFALKYAAYFYYRAKGWAVRSGIKFGTDFLLYAKGPAHSHSKYAVMVRRRDSEAESWQFMFAQSRVCSQVRKALVVCYVDPPAPGNETCEQANAVPDLTEYQIHEYLIERFNPNRK
ncbi:tRNA splicing endonuclease subunit sen2 [Coemansia sp. RSA 2706]|nr:tRNA splicing endonuclease subunit sen2 [Coemansia sp. RSA 2706]